MGHPVYKEASLLGLAKAIYIKTEMGILEGNCSWSRLELKRIEKKYGFLSPVNKRRTRTSLQRTGYNNRKLYAHACSLLTIPQSNCWPTFSVGDFSRCSTPNPSEVQSGREPYRSKKCCC